MNVRFFMRMFVQCSLPRNLNRKGCGCNVFKVNWIGQTPSITFTQSSPHAITHNNSLPHPLFSDSPILILLIHHALNWGILNLLNNSPTQSASSLAKNLPTLRSLFYLYSTLRWLYYTARYSSSYAFHLPWIFLYRSLLYTICCLLFFS